MMKITALLFAMMSVPAMASSDVCTQTAVDLRWDGGASRFTVELADDAAERAQGLMFRESMGRFAGMLFAYQYEQPVSFWMKNTLIPLDMLFFDAKGVLQNVQLNARPLDTTGLFGGNAIQYVLEVNGGTVEKLGIKKGAQMRFPLIGDDAAWAC
tara:strand:- start:4377 stop:4841 length:465 start_codon:yes stop_codon:yes gene_type:complete